MLLVVTALVIFLGLLVLGLVYIYATRSQAQLEPQFEFLGLGEGRESQQQRQGEMPASWQRLNAQSLLQLRPRSKIQLRINHSSHSPQQTSQQTQQKTHQVEVVNTVQTRKQGLSGRSSLGADGMLFVFAQPAQHQFWMKDMKFPLDFVWINQGQVVDLAQNIPAPTSASLAPHAREVGQSESVQSAPSVKKDLAVNIDDGNLVNSRHIPRISPSQPCDMVLEVEAGWVEQQQVRVGDEVWYSVE